MVIDDGDLIMVIFGEINQHQSDPQIWLMTLWLLINAD